MQSTFAVIIAFPAKILFLFLTRRSGIAAGFN
jgi:hypothetical protein